MGSGCPRSTVSYTGPKPAAQKVVLSPSVASAPGVVALLWLVTVTGRSSATFWGGSVAAGAQPIQRLAQQARNGIQRIRYMATELKR